MIVVMWTCANVEEARTIVRELVEKKLVACGNIIPNVESIYEWEGKIETSKEAKVFLKTNGEKFDSVKSVILDRSSYAVPEISAIAVEKANPAYVEWLNAILTSC